jgi:hypothetical protein
MTYFDKAIIGALSAGILNLLALVQITGDMTVEQASTAIATGIVTGIAVYMKRNAV